MGVHKAWEAKRAFAPRLEIGIRNQRFLENPEVGILISINWLILAMTVFFAGMKLTLHQSQVHSCLLCHAVMSLQFTHVPSLACRGGLRKSRADCSTVGLYCVTITWHQICKGSPYITVASVLLHETVERRRLGR